MKKPKLDEFHYHEMISHPSLFTLQNAKNVLVIGGGDGGTVREVLRHSNIEKVTMVEIDGEVIKACKEHLPEIAAAFDEKMLPLGLTYSAHPVSLAAALEVLQIYEDEALVENAVKCKTDFEESRQTVYELDKYDIKL